MSDQKVRDIVLPIFTGKWSGNSFAFEEVAGTAFLIGKRGFAVTAAHVVDQIQLAESAVATVPNGSWMPYRILNAEKHPSEDVAVIQLETVLGPSWMVLGSSSEHQSCQYHAWGYPIAIAEMGARYNEDGLQTPDLVFTSGYVRRRISRELPSSIYRGQAFYELNEVAGDGCSGGPVVNIRHRSAEGVWEIMGIYIGAGDAGTPVGYATRSDSFHSWVPKLLGRSIRDESLDR
ncbi:S1 family peptidase [Herbaspirillum seropedicae]|uniref:S1 family peptidase n=1 Tax=Herbaspirillum seropedicae TaxID=964 RepID=UPI003D951726